MLELDSNTVVKAFEEHQAAFPPFLLRSALENMCLASSAFLTIKNQFIKSMAAFSAATYLIGLGDRHPDNFLVDVTDGEVLGIDFGIAFGSSVHLSIPELMPFRLTQQIEGVIAPHPLSGIYKQTMVHALSAFRKHKSLILDTCEIFVKEPLLDWFKDARKRNRSRAVAIAAGEAVDHSLAAETQRQDEPMDELSWYPRKKVEVVKKKLLGVNPVKILHSELKDSVHASRPHMSQLENVIRGSEGSLRFYHLARPTSKRFLEVEDQVDILIELARDPDVLGRTWIGWSPYM